MRILIVGAGALGGYFGGRLLEAKRDVTFLVRSRRAEELAKNGLLIKSPCGDYTNTSPAYLLTDQVKAPFDLILVGCKAYDLAETMNSFSKAVGPETSIIPLLNGLSHIEQLSGRFGKEHVLGCICRISSTLGPKGTVLHLINEHTLTFGELDGSNSSRIKSIATTFSKANFIAHVSDEILQEMWWKWVFIASFAGITCLMRASIGDIVAAGASGLALDLLEESASIAALKGFPLKSDSLDGLRIFFSLPHSEMTASMLRDMEQGAPLEADHIMGDLLRQGEKGPGNYPLLRVAYAHMKTYEIRRNRKVIPLL